MCQSSMLMSQCDAPKQCGCEIATLSSNCIASIQIFCLPERRTSSVLGGKNSKEKNVLPSFYGLVHFIDNLHDCRSPWRYKLD